MEFERIASDVLTLAHGLLSSWFPAGKMRGNEFYIGNLAGDPGKSLKININTGQWCDFHTGEKGGDLVSLYAAREGLSQKDAATAVDELLGNGRETYPPPVRKTKRKKEPPLETAPPDMPPPEKAEGYPVVASWPYHGLDGSLLGYDCRVETNQGKAILPFRWVGDRWVQLMLPKPRPLYGLDEVSKRPKTRVVVSEGCKAAEAAGKLLPMCVAATWQGGTQAVKHTDWTPLKGREVWIWPDADEPGIKAGDDVAAALKGVAEKVKIIDVSGQPDKWDAADALAEGWTPEQTLEWVRKNMREFTPREDKPPPNEAKDYAGTPAKADKKAIADLAALPELEYERVREDTAKRLGCRTSILDMLVKAKRKPDGASDGGLRLELPEPWPEPVDGAELLDDFVTTLRRYITADPEVLNAAALWSVFAHTHDAFGISPLLAITSPVPECGKSTLLSLIAALVPKPLSASNITPAAVFRTVEKWSPTLLVDEADSFMLNNDELRGILNSGHLKASAFVIRTVGDDYEPKQFRTWAPKAIALIGKLPATLASRAIHIQLRRATLAEAPEPLRIDRLDLTQLLRQAARWAADHLDELRAADPELPAGFYCRAADNWRPIIAIADLAGDAWPKRARAAAQALAGVDEGMTRGIELLEDIRGVFGDRGTDQIASAALAVALGEMEDRRWPEWGGHGKPITATGIARLLKPFEIKPTKWKEAGKTVRGYVKVDFDDSFCRYLRDPNAPNATALKIKDISEYPNATRGAAVADGKTENLNEN